MLATLIGFRTRKEIDSRQAFDEASISFGDHAEARTVADLLCQLDSSAKRDLRDLVEFQRPIRCAL